jgi:hypothetical protein
MLSFAMPHFSQQQLLFFTVINQNFSFFRSHLHPAILGAGHRVWQ